MHCVSSEKRPDLVVTADLNWLVESRCEVLPVLDGPVKELGQVKPIAEHMPLGIGDGVRADKHRTQIPLRHQSGIDHIVGIEELGCVCLGHLPYFLL
jgi:hypothetical protein